MKKVLLCVLLLVGISCSAVDSKSSSCPSKEKVQANLKNVIGDASIEVVNVTAVKGFDGICEAFVKIDGDARILYIDKSGRYLLTGNLIDLVERRNITRDRMYELDVVTSDYLKKLEKHVNLEYKKGSKFIYVITDPDCPVCKRAEKPLIDWANKNNVTLKILLYPIESLHPDAYAKSVAIVCENRSFVDYINRNFGNTSCDRGKRAIDSNKELLGEIGIAGTPTFIGMNGKKITGLPSDINELDNLIK
ncbi:MAG: DsbC family protein [Thermosulfidibacteraceae bacterium]|jgi:thiol:disulfide interchange protein DsbC